MIQKKKSWTLVKETIGDVMYADNTAVGHSCSFLYYKKQLNYDKIL